MKKIQLLSIIILSGAIAFGAKASDQKAQVYFQKSLTSVESNSSIADLVIDSKQAIHGIQFDIEYDPAKIKSVTLEAIPGFEVNYNELSPGLMRGLVFSFQGLALPESIPFKINGDGNVKFKDVILADSNGGSVPVQSQDYDYTDGPNLPYKTAITGTHPNPFNPTATISYDLAYNGHVEIMIYDATGRLVTELVNQHQDAGRFDISWNASNQASGMYFAKMVAGDVVQTQKLVLLK